jgi:hypothetical protein
LGDEGVQREAGRRQARQPHHGGRHARRLAANRRFNWPGRRRQRRRRRRKNVVFFGVAEGFEELFLAALPHALRGRVRKLEGPVLGVAGVRRNVAQDLRRGRKKKKEREAETSLS